LRRSWHDLGLNKRDLFFKVRHQFGVEFIRVLTGLNQRHLGIHKRLGIMTLGLVELSLPERSRFETRV